MYAAISGHTDCVNELVKVGAGVNFIHTTYQVNFSEKKSTREKTMAHISTYLVSDKIIEESKYKAKLSLQENDSIPVQFSALKIAAQHGHVECVKALIDAGADVNDCAMNTSVLMQAALKDHVPCLKVLAAAGADVNFTNARGSNALYMAMKHGHVNSVQALIATGANVNSANNHHSTAVMVAAEYGFNSCVEELIKAGADVNRKDLDGDTALMCASITGKSQCLSPLIEAGTDVNIANNEGYVPIMCFARNGDDQSLTKLIEAGADVNIVNKHGETAFKKSQAKSHLKCIGVLVQAGAVVSDRHNEKKKVLLDPEHRSMGFQDYGLYPGCSGGACKNGNGTANARTASKVTEFDIEQPPPYEELFPSSKILIFKMKCTFVSFNENWFLSTLCSDVLYKILNCKVVWFNCSKNTNFYRIKDLY